MIAVMRHQLAHLPTRLNHSRTLRKLMPFPVNLNIDQINRRGRGRNSSTGHDFEASFDYPRPITMGNPNL